MHCGRQKVILADSFKGYKHKPKVKCSCQNVFTAIPEFRNRVRKKTTLRETYINRSQEDSTGSLIVVDVSESGLAFSSLDVKKIKVRDTILEFTLDDEYQTAI